VNLKNAPPCPSASPVITIITINDSGDNDSGQSLLQLLMGAADCFRSIARIFRESA
jgi:hypothetical protein